MPRPAKGALRPNRGWIRILSLALLAVGLAYYLAAMLAPTSARLVVPLAPLEVIPLRKADHLPARPGALAGSNLLLVTLDTTRSDRIHLYGNAAIRTPTLDRLAREGAVFSDAIAVAPSTMPAHASILTGEYPEQHGAHLNAATDLSDGNLTLAEILTRHGFQTAAFVSSFVLDKRFGLAQGFATYDDRMTQTPLTFSEPQRSAEETTTSALTWLSQAKQPFFAWIHYMDPHAEYSPPGEFRREYAANPYDGEIAYVDQQLGRLLDGIDPAVLSHTIIIVLADHGEGLGHHGEATHGILLHEAALRVPLIFKLPAPAEGGLLIERTVSQVDIVPTVLSLLGIALPDGLAGLALTEPPPADRALFAETRYGLAAYGLAPLRAVYQSGLKYVDGPSPELYDRVHDPLESHNLYSLESEPAAQLRAMLEARSEPDLYSTADSSREVSPAERAKLQALGYVTGDAVGNLARERRLDPVKMLPVLNEITLLVTARGNDESFLARLRYWLGHVAAPPTTKERIARLEEIAAEHPEFIAAHKFLAIAYEQIGEHAKAKAERERAALLR